MPRLARKDLETPYVHVMIQGVNKEYIFYKEKYVEKYLEMFNKNKELYNITVIAYCMMNNHAHFLLYTEDITELGKFMHKTNLNYAQMYNKEENRIGVLFRNRYQTEAIYDIKYLINCIKYIHNNPVKAKIVAKCEDYKYSSYNDYINNTGVTQSDIMKELFGEKYDYAVMFNETYNKRFMDIEESIENVEQYINDGIIEFKKENSVDISDIFADREVLTKLIKFLKNSYRIKYIEIRKYFEISRGIMDNLKDVKS